jgi:hypothetical protein
MFFKTLTLAEIEAMPVMHEGQYMNLLAETSKHRLWHSRLTVEDGVPYNNAVHVEELQDHRWVEVRMYPAR